MWFISHPYQCPHWAANNLTSPLFYSRIWAGGAASKQQQSLVGDNKNMAEMYAGSEIADITSAQIYWSKPVMKPNLL